ncbi:MAG: O-antigen ligase family protein [bacterium]|nr:O-antigen ligase family protein [bacterium]
MSKINSLLLSDNFINKIKRAAKIVLITFFLSPIFAMIAYLIVNKYIPGYVSLYSLVPSDVFYYIMRFTGAFGILITFFYVYPFIIKKEKPKNWKLFIVIGVLLLWMFICDLLAEDRSVSFFGALYREEGFITILCYVGIVGTAYILLSDKNSIKFFLRLITIISCIIAFLVFLQSCRVYIPFFESGYYNQFYMGPFYHFNHYGYYLTITLMANIGLFYIEEKKLVKGLLLGAFTLQSYALVLCYTFGCFLAVLFGLICFVVFYWIKNGKTHLIDYSFIVILFVVALLVLLTPYESVFADFLRLTKDVSDIASGKEADHAGSSRWMLWKISFETIGKHPIFGIGSDMSTAEMFNNICNRPHNEFIQYALFYGIPGGLLYFSMLVMILLPCLLNIKKISRETFFCFIITLAYLFSALFGNTTYYITPIFLTFLIWCLKYKDDIVQNEGANEGLIDTKYNLENEIEDN